MFTENLWILNINFEFLFALCACRCVCLHKVHLCKPQGLRRSAELASASVVQQFEESSLLCRRVIWIELIRRPLAAASAGCHADVSSTEKETVPQVALLREAVVCMCAFHVLLCVRRIPEMFVIDFKPMLSSVYFIDITSDIKINSPAPRVCFYTFLRATACAHLHPITF